MEPPDDPLTPDVFEPYLAEHPDDLTHREAAVVWFTLYDSEDSQAQARHVRALLRWHPGSSEIHLAGVVRFHADPEFRAEVLAGLEAAHAAGRCEHGVLSNLARVCGYHAIPPRLENDDERQRYRQYFGLADDYVIPTAVDVSRASQAAEYYRAALALADVDAPGYSSLYAKGLVDTLSGLGRVDEALDVLSSRATTAGGDSGRPDLEVKRGRLLLGAGRIDEAEGAFQAAIREDLDGYEHGGHVTAHAHLGLGEIALDRGDVNGADAHLLAAADVAPCCHTGTQGLPMRLANRLVAAGRMDVVERFCTRVLATVCPGDGPATRMLDQIRAQSSRR